MEEEGHLGLDQEQAGGDKGLCLRRTVEFQVAKIFKQSHLF